MMIKVNSGGHSQHPTKTRDSHDEGDLLSFASSSSENDSKVLCKSVLIVLVTRSDREDGQTTKPSDEASDCSLLGWASKMGKKVSNGTRRVSERCRPSL